MEGGLKYELCFLYYYKRIEDHLEILDRTEEEGLTLEEIKKRRNDKILDVVQKTFPYESQEILIKVQKRILKNIECGIHPGSAYKLIKERFKHQLESISSSNLFHFTKSADYLLLALKNKSLHPTVADFNEYFPAHKVYAILGDPEVYAPLKELQKSLSDLKAELLDAEVSKQQTVSKFKLPIFSCFTEMPEASLSFHAHHYGFWGIAFNKEKMIFKREWETVSDRPYSLCPVLYVGNRDNYIEEMLRSNIIKGEGESEGWNSFKELLKIKPILIDNLSHDTIFSTYFEREWRYISDRAPFTFDYDDIESIFVSREFWDYQNLLRREPSGYEGDQTLAEIIKIVEKNKIKVTTIENMLLHKSGTLL